MAESSWQQTTAAVGSSLCFCALLLVCACDDAPRRGPAPASTTASTSAAKPSASTSTAAPTPAPAGSTAWRRLADRWLHPNPIPNFELVAQDGKRFRLGNLSDGHVLVGFIFTSCSVAKACPLTTSKMHEVGKLWSARQKAGTTEGRKLRLLSLTFDPETDSPAVLASYSELVRRDVPDWIFATGPEELMEKALPSMFDVIARRNDQGTLNHTVRVALLGPGLRAQQIWTDNAFTPKEVVERVLR